jgi:16S rRNA (cytosine1402-N4)-methyltransferase
MNTHQSVLLDAAVDALLIKPDGIYLDATFGRGGHSRMILDRLGPNGRLFAIDKDLEAIEFAKAHFGSDSRFCVFHGSYANMSALCSGAGIHGQINGILMDLGVSSPQLDEAERGFSFMRDGPLDMRMDRTQVLDAKTFINTAPLELLVTVFRTFGEERYAQRIATAIINARLIAPIETTGVLAAIVKEAHPRWEKHKHPATRVFQAIRIYVNQELDDLTAALEQVLEMLAPAGRLAVISFHSLEDRLVKQFMRLAEHGVPLPRQIPVRFDARQVRFKAVKGVARPLEVEVGNNVRARSAVLRIGEKVG